MTTDKELLEYAAKAAGLELVTPTMLEYDKWNPLTDDGDAFRLMVELDIEVYQGDNDGPCVCAGYWSKAERRDVTRMYCIQPMNTDQIAATRRAIVRAAAELGKRMIEEEALDSR